jgi:hypothetical protein
MSNFSNIESELEVLKLISKCKDKYRSAILKNADKKLINAICECVFNMLKGNLKVDENTKANLYKYKNILRKLVQKSSLKTKRKILQQKGGFLQVLLPTILPTLISSIAAYLGSRNSK